MGLAQRMVRRDQSVPAHQPVNQGLHRQGAAPNLRVGDYDPGLHCNKEEGRTRSCLVAIWRSSSLARSTRERPLFMMRLLWKCEDGRPQIGATHPRWANKNRTEGFRPGHGCNGCRTNLSGGPQGKNPCSHTQNTYNTYNKPLSANETIALPLPATMKWSRTRTSISANEAFSVCVRDSSARLGSATPDAALCAPGGEPAAGRTEKGFWMIFTPEFAQALRLAMVFVA